MVVKPNTPAVPAAPAETPSTPSAPSTTRRKPAEVAFAVRTDVKWEPRKRGAATGPRKRSEYQAGIDTMVQNAFDTGQPVFMEVLADGEIVKDLERRIRNSGTHLGYGIKFGEDQESDKPGFIVMGFTVGKKRTRKPNKPKD